MRMWVWWNRIPTPLSAASCIVAVLLTFTDTCYTRAGSLNLQRSKTYQLNEPGIDIYQQKWHRILPEKSTSWSGVSIWKSPQIAEFYSDLHLCSIHARRLRSMDDDTSFSFEACGLQGCFQSCVSLCLFHPINLHNPYHITLVSTKLTSTRLTSIKLGTIRLTSVKLRLVFIKLRTARLIAIKINSIKNQTYLY